MAAIPAPCARVERMRPAAQAGGPQAAERRVVLPARPPGPAPVLGDAGRARGVQSRRKTRFASAGRVVQLARCGEVASPWHASMHVGQSRPLACCSAPDQGRRKIHFIHSEITDSHLAIIDLKARWDRLLLLERPVPRCVQATGKQHTSPLLRRPIRCHVWSPWW